MPHHASGAIRGRAANAPPEPSENFAEPYGSALMRAESRDSLRATRFLCTTFCPTPRIRTGCAALNASCADFLLPLAIAVSTFFRYVLMRDSRAVFTALRRSA